MIDDIMAEAREKMRSTLSYLAEDLAGIRSGRASTALVDRLKVDYYGQESELRQLANISTPEALQILIRPYDKAAIRNIERAIMQANVGATPGTDGDVIRLNMPPLTRERRQELVKHLNRRVEEARVSVRNIRRAANDDLKEFEREKLISEDEMKQGQTDVQQLTDDSIAKVDEMGRYKETEILEV